MNWLVFKNSFPINIKKIPEVPMALFHKEIIEKSKGGQRVISFFSEKIQKRSLLYAVLADDQRSRLFIISTEVSRKQGYPSLTAIIPALYLFERELYEESGILPMGHPWLKPVRSGIAGISSKEKPYDFFRMEGEEIHEVGVGPIHAGVIEPGYFRFSCHGEDVHHLEIQLGFQHRGIEELFLKNRDNSLYLTKLAESIAGDTVIGHAVAFARTWESLSGVRASARARTLRSIALELERIGNHLGDLAAICTDIAYLTGGAAFGALRTQVINTTMAICGSRFGRDFVRVGGVSYDIDKNLSKEILAKLEKLGSEVEIAAGVLFSSASVLSRLEKTGIISKETAESIKMVGPAARASGLSLDVRADHPFDGYETILVDKIILNTGDVFARAYMRYMEIKQSIKIIREALPALPGGELKRQVSSMKPDHLTVSMTEAWRGEITHVARTDSRGKLQRYKIKDPSFHNWFALALAVRGNGISDFPLCNKSFNLSYCGFDL